MSQPTVETTQPVDLYREVHKGLRRSLFAVTEAAGALGESDAPSMAEFVDRFGELDMMLTTHHGHEDSGELVRLIGVHCAPVVGKIEEAHEQLTEAFAALRESVVRVAAGSGDVDALYDGLVRFTTDYLTHMAVEEHQVMPALQQHASADELMSITMAIRTSVPPPDMVVFLKYMLPAMNPAERAAMLGGMKAGAPPEIFEMFWSAATDCLGEADLSDVASRIGV